MALNFPDNPGIGSVFVDTNSGFSFKWDGTVWNGFAGSSASEISNLDSIAGSFNGSTTTFALAKDSASVSPLSAVQLRVVLGGVTQTAGTDYTISGSNITFTTAPLAGLTCTITQLGVALSLADPANGSVTPAKLSTGGPKWNSSGDFYISGIATANNGLVVGVGLTLADDVKINLGDNDDLQIVHDGSNSLIDGAGTGGVHLKSNTEIKFLKRTGSENILVGTADGSVAAFYDNTKRLETTNGGALVYGTVGAAQTALVVEGDIKATGVVTAVSFNGEVAGAAATTNSTGLHVVGVATVLNVNATNVTAGVVTATTFSGALSGNATSATTATTATNVTVADESSDTSCNVLFTTAATGDLAPKSGTNLTFNSSSGALTATSFVGDLTGNVTGNATGLSGTPNIDCGTGSFTGDIDIADKIIHTGDTNTAIRFPSTDTITFETSGSERLRIDSSGIIQVKGDGGNNNKIYGYDGSDLAWIVGNNNSDDTELNNFRSGNLLLKTNGSERSRIDSSGRLLIGETSAVLDSSNALLQLGASEGANMVLYRDDSSVSTDDSLGLIRFYSNAGSSKQEHARITATAGAASGDGDKPGNLLFYTTADGAASPTERLRITSAGLVGINTTPGTLLELKGESSKEATITFNRSPVQGTNDGVIGEFMFENATDSVALLSVKRESAADDAYFQFATQASGGGMTERLRIGSSGQIGLSGANYGTSGQVLTSNGSGSAPTWQDTGTPTIASQAEAEAGTNNTNMMTPLRVKQAIDALGGNVIASIQRGTTAANNFPNSTTRNQSITSVNTSKAFVNYNGQTFTGNAFNQQFGRVQLTSSTNLAVTGSVITTSSPTIGWEVVEFV